MPDTDRPAKQPSRKVKAAHVNKIRLIRARERPFDTVIQITTAQGQIHFLLPEYKADELGQKLQSFAAQGLQPIGNA